MKCLWCGKETDGYFCIGGGKNLEGKTVKSHCMDSFLTMLKGSKETGSELTKEEAEYVLWEEQIKEWYKGIPLVFEKAQVTEDDD